MINYQDTRTHGVAHLWIRLPQIGLSFLRREDNAILKVLESESVLSPMVTYLEEGGILLIFDNVWYRLGDKLGRLCRQILSNILGRRLRQIDHVLVVVSPLRRLAKMTVTDMSRICTLMFRALSQRPY